MALLYNYLLTLTDKTISSVSWITDTEEATRSVHTHSLRSTVTQTNRTLINIYDKSVINRWQKQLKLHGGLYSTSDHVGNNKALKLVQCNWPVADPEF